jgi:hypothetical protein
VTDNENLQNDAQVPDPATEQATAPTLEVVSNERVFKIGSQTIYENEVTYGLSNEDVRGVLKASFPEIANATIGTRSDNGVSIVEFLPQPGRKG